MAFTRIYLFLWFVTVGTNVKASLQGNCQNATIPLCKNLDYPHGAFLPNLLNHKTQEQAGLEVHQFFPLVKVRCSDELSHLLCAVYLPRCYTTPPFRRPPCRELCEAARDGCATLMSKFGFKWPDTLQCDKFPYLTDGDALCYMHTPDLTTATTATASTTNVPSTRIAYRTVPAFYTTTPRNRSGKRRLGYRKFLSIFKKSLFGMKEELSLMLSALSED